MSSTISEKTGPPDEERFVIDDEGNRVAVIVDIKQYEKLREAELEQIRAYDQAKESGDEKIPFDQAVREIEQERG
jgi:hypothetical protein